VQPRRERKVKPCHLTRRCSLYVAPTWRTCTARRGAGWHVSANGRSDAAHPHPIVRQRRAWASLAGLGTIVPKIPATAEAAPTRRSILPGLVPMVTKFSATVEAARVQRNLSPIGGKALANERQARLRVYNCSYMYPKSLLKGAHMAKSDLDKTVATLGVLNRAELQELLVLVNDMIDTGYFDPAGAADRANGVKAGEAKGYVETKLIRDAKHGKVYGPYLYLRVWRDGVLTSKYLGKANGSGEAAVAD
jgi:hypothetical protein